jgi:hypothetical protein
MVSGSKSDEWAWNHVSIRFDKSYYLLSSTYVGYASRRSDIRLALG